ncbi:MAG: ABC transporter permease [Caldilineae bacterium]|nr:MAG: ABC transporter permease [Caldilineae bacterium]
MAEQTNLFDTSSRDTQSLTNIQPTARGPRYRRLLAGPAHRAAVARVLLAPATILVFLIAWEALVRWQDYPTFILPRPSDVWLKLLITLGDGTLQQHTLTTLSEILGGLALGLSTALLLGYLLAKSPMLDRLLSPYIVALQSFPIIAVAPLLVIWIHNGTARTVLISALTLFFPALVSTIVGMRAVEPELLALMRSLQASRWQIFTKLEIPSALPMLFGGLKVGVTLSVIGAVIGEFVGADRGLGFLINLARGLLDTPLLFVALFTLVAIALGLYALVSLIEYRLLAWKRAT